MNIEDVSFNPRAREGRDKAIGGKASPEQVSIHAPARGATFRDEAIRPFREVSIHAPARGATRMVFGCMSYFMSFNPRAREGRDGVRTSLSQAVKMFQSTRPRGARREPRCPAQAFLRFNPRAREGRDQRPAVLFDNPPVSIHAPARGATRCFCRRMLARTFQSTRPRGARRHLRHTHRRF